MRRKLKLETRYLYVRRDAKILTAMLRHAGESLYTIANAADEGRPVEAKSARELADECARIVRECGR